MDSELGAPEMLCVCVSASACPDFRSHHKVRHMVTAAAATHDVELAQTGASLSLSIASSATAHLGSFPFQTPLNRD